MCVLCISSGRSRWSDSRRTVSWRRRLLRSSYSGATLTQLLRHQPLTPLLGTAHQCMGKNLEKYKGTLCQRRTPPAEYSLTLSYNYCSHTLAEYSLPSFCGLLFCSCLYLEKLSLYEILIDYFSPNFANAWLIYVKICKTSASSSA